MVESQTELQEKPELNLQEVEAITNYDEMGLKEELLRGIYGYGFEKPSPVQQKCIKLIIQGKDLIVRAQSGTGKTSAYSIGLLQLISIDNNDCQALVLSPTRELSIGINKVIQYLGQYLNIQTHALIGGTCIRESIKVLQQKIHVAVGTPGRVCDMMQRKNLDTQSLKILIVDEADEILSRGFEEQIQEILKFIPLDIQVCFFSCTFPPELLGLAFQFMRDPVQLLIRNEPTLGRIKQYYVAIEKEESKMPILIEILENIVITSLLIFCKNKRTVDLIAKNLNEQNFLTSAIHADITSNEKEKQIQQFRTGETRILILTDLFARCIDVSTAFSINFDMPTEKEIYLHRIGRSGLYGMKGVAINFVTPSEFQFLKELENYYSILIEELPKELNEIL